MRWVKRIALGLVAVLFLAAVVVWLGGHRIIDREHEVQARGVLLSSRPEVLTEGERLARLYGCYHGCHGPDMEGQLFFETPLLDRVITPDLTAAVSNYSPDELEAIVRQGVLPGGRSVLGMPSASFASMTDQQLSAILSFIREYPLQSSGVGHSRYGFVVRFMLLTGAFEPAAAERTDDPWSSTELDDPMRHGEYLALNACSECHGLDFSGQEEFAPPLDIAKAYDRAAFGRLMSEGVGVGDRDLGLMSAVARNRFSVMTDDEIDHLHGFLQSR